MSRREHHRHLPWGVTPQNKFATSEETAYPFALARDIAAAFVQAFLEAGMVAPPSTFSEMQSQSEHVLQAVRAQSGLQPKIAKLPPLVPEFANIVTRQVDPTACPEPIPNAKRLASNPIEEARMKRGCESRAPVDSEDLMEGAKATCETWGIYHSPEEFVAKAVEAGHPHGMQQLLPQILSTAVKRNSDMTVTERARHRTHKIKQWLSWAQELAGDEKVLKESMHKDVRAILANKKVKLWEKILIDAQYPDMGVVNEFVNGTSLVGEVEQCGLWPSKFAPAGITESELLEISERDKSATLERVSSSANPSTDGAVWQKTMDEVERGWLVGPLSPNSVPNHCPLSRRFGVVQGPKVRCVDDFTSSSVNLAVQVTDSPKPHTVDVLSSLMVEAMAVCPGGEPWVARTFDLRDAYRQCAVAPGSSQFSHIAVRNPSNGEASIFRMLALIFGSIKSVHSFLRIAHSLWYILTVHLDILVTNYFDDFVVLARQSEAAHLTSVINSFLTLLGRSFAEDGAKAPPFSGTAHALGVKIDVSDMHNGRAWVDNTESRKEDISSAIKKVTNSRELATAEALKLRGRLQFTSGQLFGRLSRTTLSKITHHAYRSCSAKVHDDLCSALTWYDKLLVAGKPRLVTCGMQDTWFVFTDASYEVENDIPSAGFGGVLVDPKGCCVAHFGFKVEGDQLRRLNPSGKKTIIHECEFLAVAIALRSWGHHLRAKQVVCFIDNNAVRDSLISAKASGGIAGRILECVLLDEADNGLMMWFARVPSKSNIADDPSRGCCKLLERLGSKELLVDVKSWWDIIVPDS